MFENDKKKKKLISINLLDCEYAPAQTIINVNFTTVLLEGFEYLKLSIRKFVKRFNILRLDQNAYKTGVRVTTFYPGCN